MIRWFVSIIFILGACYCIYRCSGVIKLAAPYHVCHYVPAPASVNLIVSYSWCEWSHWLWAKNLYAQMLQWTTFLLFFVLAAALTAPEK
jgi:hypothetical protein